MNKNYNSNKNNYLDDELFEQRKKNIIDYINSDNYIPMKRGQIAIMLSVPNEQMPLFDYIINHLISIGLILENKKGKIIGYKALNYNIGTFISTNKGFGFVSVDDDENDIFIPSNLVNGAFNRDKVLFRINKKSYSSSRRSEGEILKIVERANTRIVGTFEKCNNFGFVIPDDNKFVKDIFISRNNTKGAVTGHKVVVEITKFQNDNKKNPEGNVVEILGHINDPGVDILSIIKQFDLPVEFPQDVYDYIEPIKTSVSSDDIKNRYDFRNILTITIDGDDAKDLDDAVSLEILDNNNYKLYVHIADVSHYVKENSVLDKEALKRGTSVYLVDRVIPMLPHKLSNGICSLNPFEDRLTLTCIMEIDNKGNVVDSQVVESVINSDMRMTYNDVNKIISDKDDFLRNKYSHFVNMLDNMDCLRQILALKRKKRGSVDFDFNEAKIILDEFGKPVDILPYQRNNATNLIEEFMLICNETVAEFFYWQQIPFIFRTHEQPDDEKLQKLAEFLRGFGYRIKTSNNDKIHPKSIQNIILDVYGKKEESIINRVVLRSMKQARYTPENTGHFGLASKYYSHFTSPIRRYPDLQIHRIIKEFLKFGISQKRFKSLSKKIPDIAKQCSIRERIAEEAERETDKLKMVEFMENKIGNVYQGVISSITSWGIYVELDNTVEGMISLKNIYDDFYIYDEKNICLVGQKFKKTYTLGQKVFVQVFKVDKQLRNIDFVFSDDNDVIDII